MSDILYYTRRSQPELMWRIDTELSLVEVAPLGQQGPWMLSHFDWTHIDSMAERGEAEEVPAP
jgi:hypothetical protein